MFLIRVPDPADLPSKAPSHPSFGVVDPVIIKGTMLRDPSPLFLPTEFSSSRKDYMPSEPGGAFAGFPAKPIFADAELSLHLPSETSIPRSPADALVGEPPDDPYIGFGRKDLQVQALAPRGAFVEITDAGNGRSVFAQAVDDAHPPESVAWKPMEFMAAVDASGLVGPLVLTEHSDVAEVDAYFGRYLAETLRVGQRLAPGFYRISVGP
jgi:hypothetical protein